MRDRDIAVNQADPRNAMIGSVAIIVLRAALRRIALLLRESLVGILRLDRRRILLPEAERGHQDCSYGDQDGHAVHGSHRSTKGNLLPKA